jgi:hypothetical protein
MELFTLVGKSEDVDWTYRFWLLAHTVQNLSLNLSSGTMLLSACASLAPSMLAGTGSAGGGGGGGGTDAACC